MLSSLECLKIRHVAVWKYRPTWSAQGTSFDDDDVRYENPNEHARQRPSCPSVALNVEIVLLPPKLLLNQSFVADVQPT